MKIEVGKTWFRDSYADGRPKFVVREDMGNGTYRCVSEDDLDYNGLVRYYDAQQIRSKVEWERNLNRAFQSQDDFWERQEVGTVLHYHNGFGEFVRGVVVLEDGLKKLQPTAMVGNWKSHPHYMPKRKPNGEIDYGYYGEKIRNCTGAWQPSETCVFESDCYARRDQYPDPRKAEPIDLSVPDMTPEQEKEALLEQAIERVRAILDNRYQTSAPAREVLGQIEEEVRGFNGF